ncbi:hypothetical protein M1N69_04500 [Thermodesulfovibrionales bacterium]|nr:hypothetical protein [Thermodesulfovibrionales bacterium]
MKVKSKYREGILVLPENLKLNKQELYIEIPDDAIREPQYEKLDEYKDDLIELIENIGKYKKGRVPSRNYKEIIGEVLAKRYRDKELD